MFTNSIWFYVILAIVAIVLGVVFIRNVIPWA
jgi:uncharacterized membrane-anchored protein YhcB (DUF1043 family)